MTEQTSHAPECVIFLLAKAYQRAHGIFKGRLDPYGLTNIQHLVLEALWVKQGFTATELGKILVLDKATLSGVLDRMVDGGWIEKMPDPDDGRVQRIYTSKKAEEIKDELIGERKKANDEILAPFSLEERVLLKRLLRDIM